MRRGVAHVRLPAEASVTAPYSGVQLGVGENGPALLRLFRLTGTSIVAVSAVPAAQLLAVRTAAAGTPVQIVTARPDLWRQVAFSDRLCHVFAPGDQLRPPDGPSLLVDDRPMQARTALDTAPWQCRLDVRTVWVPRDLGGFAYADLTLLGALPPEAVSAVAGAYRVPPAQAAALARLEPGVLGLARRGRLEFVQLNPTQAESALMTSTQGVPNQPIWR